MNRRTLLLSFPGVLLPSLLRAETGGPLPQGVIKITAGFAVGGAADGLARAAAQVAKPVLHRDIIVENKPGAAGSVAILELSRSKPDGSALGVLLTGVIVNQYLRKPGYDVQTDVTPIIMFGTSAPGVVVRADSKFKDFKSLLAYAKQHPGKVMFGTGGVGSAHHLAMLNLAKLDSINWTHVPYKSGPEAIRALMAGDLDFVALTPEWTPMVDDGRLRLLAVMSEERVPKYPKVPTLMELGIPVKAPFFYGLVGPRGMDPKVVELLYEAFKPAVSDPHARRIMDIFGINPKLENPGQFKATIKSSCEFYKKAAEGIKLD